jgi:hypothetical protein
MSGMDSSLPRLGSIAAPAPPPAVLRTARRLRRVLPVLCACVALAPERAHAYAIDVHAELSRQALASSNLGDKAAPIDIALAATMRATMDGYGRNTPALRDAWIKRYPQPTDFDAFAEKQLLLFSAGASVIGIDRVDPLMPKDPTLLEVVARGSSHPDEDYRNRDRLAYDQKRQPLKDKSGNLVPADPALLNMGSLGLLSSQAHAHYGLAQVEQSDDPKVLQTDPRRFAKSVGYAKSPVMTLAAEMAQIHLDLSLLAALGDGPTSRELSWQFLGEGFHYLQDVGNQAHTVQVGLYDFFVDAFVMRLKSGLLTGGGYFGKMRSLGSIGIDILTSHHVLGEELTRKRMLAAKSGNGDPVGKRLLQAPTEEDAEFAARLDTALSGLGAAPEKGEFALAITRQLIEASSREGADLYRATRAIADPRLHKQEVVFNDETDDPDRFIVAETPQNAAAFKEFWSLQERSFRRVGTAQRRVVALTRKLLAGATTPEARAELQKAVLQRLLSRQLRMVAEADARLADYLQNPPVNVTAPERAPELLAADIAIALVLAGIVALVVRRRRRATAPK